MEERICSAPLMNSSLFPLILKTQSAILSSFKLLLDKAMAKSYTFSKVCFPIPDINEIVTI